MRVGVGSGGREPALLRNRAVAGAGLALVVALGLGQIGAVESAGATTLSLPVTSASSDNQAASSPNASPMPSAVTAADVDQALMELAELESRAAAINEQMAARTVQLTTLTSQRKQLKADIEASSARVIKLEAGLAKVNKSLREARRSLATAKSRRIELAAVAKSAQRALAAADADLAAANAKLQLANGAQSRTSVALKAANKKLTSLKYGSTSYRRAFVSWQMAALAAKSAQARAVLAQESASNTAVGRAAVADETAQAQSALAAQEDRVAAATEEIEAGEAAAAPLSKELKATNKSVKAARSQLGEVRAAISQLDEKQDRDDDELARVTKSVTAARAVVTAGSGQPSSTPPAVSPSGPSESGESAPTSPPASGSAAAPSSSAATQPGPTVRPAETAATVPPTPPGAQPSPDVVAQPQDGPMNGRYIAGAVALLAGLAAAGAGFVLMRRPAHPDQSGSQGRR